MSAESHTRRLLLASTIFLGGCDWFTTFAQQPKIDPWEIASLRDSTVGSRGNPQQSVPFGGSTAPGFIYGRDASIAATDSMAGIVNPTAPSAASVANGRKYFQINCAVCHGLGGAGDGTATKYGMYGINLLTDYTKNRTDGYIFGMIRNGRGAMPPYNRIEERDRWDVVNYVRVLQGKIASSEPPGPLAMPGVTGDKLPGATVMGPTVPSPYYHPRLSITAPIASDSTAAMDTTAHPAVPPARQPSVRTDSAATKGVTP